MTSSLHAAPANLLFGSYQREPGVYDEAVDSEGIERPHWHRFAAELNQIGREELSRRWQQAQRYVYENGVTYTPHGDPQEQVRPWELDPLPLLIPAHEWHQLSPALEQRARLLNLILADLYGPQSLLTRGLIPAELVLGNPRFWRPVHGILPPEDRFLNVYATDLARHPDGSWHVVSDRTEAPSGMGYALENRVAISRMLPGIFHRSHVERLAPFFIALRETLARLAPRRRDNPRIVLLSSGPGSANYFEDAYLSRYLGYTLVEGGDLAVRDNQVWLKTLGGLLPVEVALRRLDDADCDPLELRGDASSGVVGLLQSVRADNVAVANAIGAGLIESPAFLPYLPAVCRELLGEDLKLPSVASWWCGEPEAREYVLANLDRLIIKPALDPAAAPTVFGWQLDEQAKAELAAAIHTRGAQYVGQEQAPRSSIPAWTNGGLESQRVALRAFAVASGDGYQALRGGLSRVSASSEALDLSVLSGEASKDVWVLADGPVQHVSLLQRPGERLELRRSGSELPSRAADNLFWLGRHVERAEGALRLLRATLVRLTSESESKELPELPVLLRCLAHQGQIEPDFAVEGMKAALPAIEKALPLAVFDDAQPGGLRANLTQMHRMASVVRDRISIDSWRVIHHIDRQFRRPKRAGEFDLGDLLAMLDPVLNDLSAFSGLVMENMTRTLGWQLMDLGRRLERSLRTIGLIQNSLVDVAPGRDAVLEAILEVADSLMTFRSRYLAGLQTPAVLDLLLVDETNPRSVAFQLAAIAEHVHELPRDRTRAERGHEERIAISALSAVRVADVHELCSEQRDGRRVQLERLLDRLGGQLPKLGDAISHRYLIHAGAPRHLAEYRSEGRA